MTDHGAMQGMTLMAGLSADRRRFIGGTICVAAAASAGAPALANAAATLPLAMAVHDERFGAGRHFAAEASLLGVPVQAIRGGVHDLWCETLRPLWCKRRVAVAGMTTHDAFFVLAMMAQETRMRVVFRAHHGEDEEGGAARHALFGPQAAITGHNLSGTAAQWGAAAARIVTRWPRAAPGRDAMPSNIQDASSHAIPGEGLVTWLLAPAPLPDLPIA